MRAREPERIWFLPLLGRALAEPCALGTGSRWGIGEVKPRTTGANALRQSAGCSSHRAPNYNNSMTSLIGKVPDFTVRCLSALLLQIPAFSAYCGRSRLARTTVFVAWTSAGPSSRWSSRLNVHVRPRDCCSFSGRHCGVQ
jgi:hypothetical protein